MTSFPNLRKVSELLGYHGICPEALTKIRDNSDLFGLSVRREYDEFMAGLRRLLGTPDDEEEPEFPDKVVASAPTTPPPPKPKG